METINIVEVYSNDTELDMSRYTIGNTYLDTDNVKYKIVKVNIITLSLYQRVVYLTLEKIIGDSSIESISKELLRLFQTEPTISDNNDIVVDFTK